MYGLESCGSGSAGVDGSYKTGLETLKVLKAINFFYCPSRKALLYGVKSS
jgi:hypothetical protein